MALGINSSAIAGFSTQSSQKTLTYTNTSGNYLEATAWVTDTTDAITSMTCTKGGTDSAMTKIGSIAGTGDVSSVSVWRIDSPDTGSITVKANYTGSKTVALESDSWTDAQYDTGISVVTGLYDSSAVPDRTVSETTIANNSYQKLSIVCNSDQPTASTNATDIQGTGSGIAVMRSTNVITPAGSASLTARFSSSPRQAWVMSSIAPLSAPAANGNFLMLL